MKKENEEWEKLTTVIILFIVFIIIILSLRIEAFNSDSNSNANLSIWPLGSVSGLNLSYGAIYSKVTGDWNFSFYANFTNSSFAIVNGSQGNGNCTIKFNASVSGLFNNYSNMTFNTTGFLWQFSANFTRKGNFTYEINCTSIYGNVTLNDNFTIRNTRPWINKTELTGAMTALSCTEDTLCTFNLSNRTVEDDVNDIATLLFANQSNSTTLTNYTLTSQGFLTVNKTNMNVSQSQNLIFTATDSDGGNDIATLPVSITGLNDPPNFLNLDNKTFNISSLFNFIILGNDEESDLPFVFNITFLNCTTASWSYRNSTDCTLFNSTQFSVNSTAINISFTPVKNDVGNYTINFSVRDTNNYLSPYNASRGLYVNFSVLNINEAPYFRYTCDNERNATEGTRFTCRVNVSDNDEDNNITISANFSWYTFSNGTYFNSTYTQVLNSTLLYNTTYIVNFTPRAENVGNWSINISINDTGNPKGINSTRFYFFINFINASVSLDTISNITAYTTNNYTVLVNATDENVLIPDKTIYNENISFSSNRTPYVNITSIGQITGTNKTRAQITFNPNDLGIGNHTINISVRDYNNFSSDSRIFIIRVVGNNAPQWNSSTITNHSLNEGTVFYLNLSANVSDADNDVLNFTFTNNSAFPGFILNSSTGVVNFTPTDVDVGLHYVTINVSDNATGSSLIFNFTVLNIQDLPIIERPLTITNATIDANSNINATEDNVTTISVFAQDEDLRILSGQRGYYNETLSLNLTIQGVNTSLFNFTRDNSFPTDSGTNANRSLFTTTFIPGKASLGNYNITINISDATNASNLIRFNLTVGSINHRPVLGALGNQTSTINRTFYFDINATDVEDGNDSTSSNFTFTGVFINGTSFFNSTVFNNLTGVINVTFNRTHGGIYRINITVRDTNGENTSNDFYLHIYDTLSILAPAAGFVFNLVENNQSNLSTFVVNHSVGDNLTWYFTLGSNLRNNISAIANMTNYTWSFTPNFTDETFGGFVNLTLFVFNPLYPDLNQTRNFSFNISHINSDVSFSGLINDMSGPYGTPLQINLTAYFSDIDFSDVRINQTLNFTIRSNSSSSSITTAISSDWILNLSATIAIIETLNITASDLDSGNRTITNATSNYFRVTFTTPTTTSTPSSGGGGGGGGTTTKEVPKPVSLKLILPGTVSAEPNDIILVSLQVANQGTEILRGIDLTSYVLLEGKLNSDVTTSFNVTRIEILNPGKSENVSLTVRTGGNTGTYNVIVNGTVESPVYSDWASMVLTVTEGAHIKEKIIFFKQLIIENPECAEAQELVKEAEKYYENKNFEEATKKVDEAINGCKRLISRRSLEKEVKKIYESSIFFYVLIAIVIAIILGLGYYEFRRRKMKKAIDLYLNDLNEPEPEHKYKETRVSIG
ncbi:hypothetical protein HYW75_04960 [Candidatus Pacearchaeota archaeon]|nr:hypothetical protein [Candidatus Pacearchaeota archaeon]